MKLNTKIIVYVGILAAVSAVLMFFPHFPIFPPPANFLDVDFSDVPALLASVTISPFAGVIIVLIKNLIHVLFTQTFAIGELSNLILGTVYSLTVGFVSKYAFKNTLMKKKLLAVLPIGIAATTLTALLSNYFLVMPAYAHLMGWTDDIQMLQFISMWILPFNLIKSTLQAVVFYLLYRGVSPYITKNMYLFK